MQKSLSKHILHSRYPLRHWKDNTDQNKILPHRLNCSEWCKERDKKTNKEILYKIPAGSLCYDEK